MLLNSRDVPVFASSDGNNCDELLITAREDIEGLIFCPRKAIYKALNKPKAVPVLPAPWGFK